MATSPVCSLYNLNTQNILRPLTNDSQLSNHRERSTDRRPVLMYGSETWGLRKAEQKLARRTEIGVLRWMMGINRIAR